MRTDLLDTDADSVVFDPPELGCALYLPGLPGGGSKIYDRSPYGNHGSITGAAWTRLASGLWVLSFDGLDDYIEKTGFTPDLQATADFTILMWIYPKAGGYAEQHIVGLANVQFYRKTTALYYKETATLVKAGAISEDNWNQVGIVRGGDGSRELFSQGISINSGTEASPGNPGSRLRIGDVHNGSGSLNFNGFIALGRLFSRKLSALEIRNSFDREKRPFGVW